MQPLQRRQFRQMFRQHFLVGRHHFLAQPQRGGDDCKGFVRVVDCLHDQRNPGIVQDFRRIVGKIPRIDRAFFLAMFYADPSDGERGIVQPSGQFVESPADAAEAEQPDLRYRRYPLFTLVRNPAPYPFLNPVRQFSFCFFSSCVGMRAHIKISSCSSCLVVADRCSRSSSPIRFSSIRNPSWP